MTHKAITITVKDLLAKQEANKPKDITIKAIEPSNELVQKSLYEFQQKFEDAVINAAEGNQRATTINFYTETIPAYGSIKPILQPNVDAAYNVILETYGKDLEEKGFTLERQGTTFYMDITW